MEDLFWLMVFIFFVVAPLLERVLKKGKTPPQRQAPTQRRVPAERRPLPGSTADRDRELLAEQTRRAETREDATDLLPSDLWSILTGQQPARAPAPRRQPTWDEEADRDEEEAAATSPNLPPPVPARAEDRQVAELLARRDREARELQRYRRTEPVVVSLETESLPTSAARHARFHKKIDKPKTTAPPLELEVPARDRIGPVLRGGSLTDLRRAVLMKEVLGTPKGLD